MTKKELKYPINIDYSRDALFDELGMIRLRESYMLEDEVSPQDRLAWVSANFASDAAHAQRLYDYASKHWCSFSTPILSHGRNKYGLGISCFLSYLEDTATGLVDTLSEVNWLSMLGGGVGIHVKIRGSDDKSVGVMPHLKVYDSSSIAYKQGTTRRGSYAPFLDISHPDIKQFIEMRKATGDQNYRTLNLNHGVNITDEFMELIQKCMTDTSADDSWNLIQPNTGKVVDTISAKELWIAILETRVQTGEPYMIFIDAMNRALPQVQKDMGLSIHGSNICTEISLATDKDRTAVCCLLSGNAQYYDEWKNDPMFLPDVAEMLDNVLQNFIDTAPDVISRARYSAMRERSIGIGLFGLHAHFQKNMIPFDSVLAKVENMRIFRHMKKQLDEVNIDLANKRGACPDNADAGINRRFMHMMAVAPNASTALIFGNTSPSCEPWKANVFRQDTTSGSHICKNGFLDKHLLELCKENGKDIDEVWSDITANDGSIQHLAWIPENVREVFKTALELDQRWVVELAADRQQFVDQAQSINLFFRPEVSIKYLHGIHFMAWKSGLKSLYYLRSEKLRKAAKVGAKVQRNKIEDEIDLVSLAEGTGCLACE